MRVVGTVHRGVSGSKFVASAKASTLATTTVYAVTLMMGADDSGWHFRKNGTLKSAMRHQVKFSRFLGQLVLILWLLRTPATALVRRIDQPFAKPPISGVASRLRRKR